MPTYVITVDDGRHPVEPHEVDLADLQAVRLEAARLMGDIMSHDPDDFWTSMSWKLSVQRDGLLLFELHTLVVNAPVLGRLRG